MKMYQARCSQCGARFRRGSRAELLGALREHLWKKHRGWMLSRMKAGKKNSTNPSIQDLVAAVRTGSVRSALGVRRLMSSNRYQQAKKVMDAVEPMLPEPARLAWRAIEAVSDVFLKKA